MFDKKIVLFVIFKLLYSLPREVTSAPFPDYETNALLPRSFSVMCCPKKYGLRLLYFQTVKLGRAYFMVHFGTMSL